MEAKLTFKYDREADILHIDKTPPYAVQRVGRNWRWCDCQNEPGFRGNRKSGGPVFSTRLLREDLFELPVTADLRLALKE